MDQGISTEPMSRALRLVLTFLAALFGLLLVSFVFGSSSASADDGSDTPDSLGDALGGLVSSVTEPVGETLTAVTHAVAPVTQPVTAPVTQAPAVAPVTHAVAEVTHAAPVAAITAPVAQLIDGTLDKLLGGQASALGDAVGPTPVGSILAPVAALLDGTVAEVGDVVAPSVSPVTDAPQAAVSVAAAVVPTMVAAVPVVADKLIDAAAGGSLVLEPAPPAPSDDGTVGLTSTGMTLFAATAGGMFLALLMLRRSTLVSRALPSSPVYETDSSPD